MNFTRISEDTFLEVKMIKQELGVDEWIKTQKKFNEYTPKTIDLILKILELKYDEDEEI